MKRNLLALAALAAIAGGAQAAPLDRTGAAGATNKLYISGSSALQKLVEGMVAQNCDANGMTVWRSASGFTWAGGASADSANGASHNMYACTLKAGNDFGAAYDNQTILVVKREAGGSAQGVFPIATNAPIRLLNINSANCDAAPAAFPAFGVCVGVAGSGAVTEIATPADMGISDEEPDVFNASFNHAGAQPNVGASDFFAPGPTAFGQAVMGVVVNGKLYNDLQADQVAAGTLPAGGVPNISAVGFTSILQSALVYPLAEGWSPLFTGNTPLKFSHLNVAFRGVGSGTRAAAGLYFNNYPTGSVARNFTTSGTTATNPPGFSGAVDGLRTFYLASSSGNVIANIDNCQNLSGGNIYCIGILGLEQDITGKDVKFVRVDGGLPTDARAGKYGVVYEPTFQINKTAVNAGGQALAAAFGAALAIPSNINSAFAGQGVLALPGNCPAGAFETWVAPPQSVVCSRVTRGGSSANVLQVVR